MTKKSMVQDFREGLVTNPNMIISQLADGAKLCEWDGDGFFLKLTNLESAL